MLSWQELQDAGYILSHDRRGWSVHGYDARDWANQRRIDGKVTPIRLSSEVARLNAQINEQQALAAASAHYQKQRDSVVWHEIKTNTVVDGPGERTALYVIGCAIHCPGCHSSHLWEPGPGASQTEARELAALLIGLAGDRALTITGGEPLMQARALLRLVGEIRRLDTVAGQRREIAMYTGFAYDDWSVLDGVDPDVIELLLSMDYVVEGPYDPDQADGYVQYRGSRNQRVLDIVAMLHLGELVDVSDRWDEPKIIIQPFQPAKGSEGLMSELFPPEFLGKAVSCGQAT